jgi:hypothetical protein
MRRDLHFVKQSYAPKPKLSYFWMMNDVSIFTTDHDILDGQPLFTGTRLLLDENFYNQLLKMLTFK